MGSERAADREDPTPTPLADLGAAGREARGEKSATERDAGNPHTQFRAEIAWGKVRIFSDDFSGARGC